MVLEMKKRRKSNPEKLAERKALKEWAKAVKARANFKCEFCGRHHKYLNAHHIIGKRYKPLRLDLDNGMALCPKCHKWQPGVAAHENPLNVYLKLASIDHERYERLLVKMPKIIKELEDDQKNNGNTRSPKRICRYNNNRKRTKAK